MGGRLRLRLLLLTIVFLPVFSPSAAAAGLAYLPFEAVTCTAPPSKVVSTDRHPRDTYEARQFLQEAYEEALRSKFRSGTTTWQSDSSIWKSCFLLMEQELDGVANPLCAKFHLPVCYIPLDGGLAGCLYGRFEGSYPEGVYGFWAFACIARATAGAGFAWGCEIYGSYYPGGFEYVEVNLERTEPLPVDGSWRQYWCTGLHLKVGVPLPV